MKRYMLVCTLSMLAAVAMASASVHAQTRYVLAEGSAFALDGSTALGGFSCHSYRASGSADVPTNGRLTALLSVPVEAFDCGNGRMNRDLFNALRGDEHAHIRFVLDRAETHSEADDWTDVRVWGTLTLAGVARPVQVDAQGRRENGRVRLRGQRVVRMTDFGIRPPSGPLGLVRARDAVTVRFDLTARIDGAP